MPPRRCNTTQALARVGQESIEAQKLPGGTPEERRQRDAELNRLKIEGLKAEGELQRQIDDAHQDRVVKLLELQKREMEEIQNKASGLFHTLFTKPQEFGKQLASTLKEAVLKPITEGLGGMMARAIHPLIYGSDGQGGIAGVFKGIFGGGKQDPLQAATDLNTAVTAQNSVAIASLTAVFAAAMGMAAPAIAAPGGFGGGISVPALTMPAAAWIWRGRGGRRWWSRDVHPDPHRRRGSGLLALLQRWVCRARRAALARIRWG